LRSEPFALKIQRLADGQAAITVTGPAGINFIIQASIDFKNWDDLSTATAPSVYVDAAATQYSARFYRIVMAR